MRGWKKIFHANGNQKKAGVAILVSDKIDFVVVVVVVVGVWTLTLYFEVLLLNKSLLGF